MTYYKLATLTGIEFNLDELSPISRVRNDSEAILVLNRVFGLQNGVVLKSKGTEYRKNKIITEYNFGVDNWYLIKIKENGE